MRRVFKSVVSLILAFTMFLPLTVPTFAQEETGYEEEYQRIIATLEQERLSTDMQDMYPNGVFAVAVPASEVAENVAEPMPLYIVRHGGTEGEATIKLRFTDYTARYGEDYVVKMGKSFFDKTVEEKENSTPLLYMIGGEGEDAYVNAFDSYDSLVEHYGQEAVDHMEELVDKGEEMALEEIVEEATEETEEASQKEEAVISNEISQKSPLMQFNDAVSMYAEGGVNASDYISDETYVDPEQAELAHDLMEELLVFSETEITFQDGEQIKEVYVYPKNDFASNGERVFAMVISSEEANVDINNTSTVAIKDDEPNVVSELFIDKKETPKEVQLADKSFTVTLKREESIHKVVTANFYAVTNTNQVLVAGRILLMPGMETQTVSVPMDLANLEGATYINLYLADGQGCNVPSEKVRIRIMNGENAPVLFSSSSGVSYTTSNSPIGFEGTGTYSGFDIKINDKNFKTDQNGGKQKSVENYDTGSGAWKLKIPDKPCSWDNSRTSIQSKNKLNFALVESLEIDWERNDYEPSICNRQVFSTNNNFNIDWDDDDETGTYIFRGDYDGKVEINARTGSVSPDKGLHNDSVTAMGSYGTVDKANVPSYLHFMAKKTSGGVNGSLIYLRNIHVNYRKYDLLMQDASLIGGIKPGALEIVKRDSKGSNKNDTRYATETISLTETINDDRFYLDNLQLKKSDGSWVNLSSSYFNKTNKTIVLSDKFFQDYYQSLPSDKKIELRPVYVQKKVQVTVNTDKNGGITFNGTNYAANSGSHKVTVKAGDTMTFSPYDVQQGYSFSKFEGSKSNVNNSANSWNVDFQQNTTSQTLSVENKNYVITPVYSASGTFVRIDTVGDVPAGCFAPEKTFYSLGNGDKIIGEAMQFIATTSGNYRATWTVKNPEHPWATQTFHGESFDYRVISGDNIIELSFEQMNQTAATTLTGKVVSYQGTILNPPVSDGAGGFLGEAAPLANAEVIMGKYKARTDNNGSFALSTYAEAAEGSANNTTYTLQAYPNEQRTLRVMCNNMVNVYVMKTADSVENGKIDLTKEVITDFYGSGPTPSSFYVMTGIDKKSPPTQMSVMSSVPLADNTVGFRLQLDGVNEEYPVSRVDFIVVAADGTPRTTYPVPTRGNSRDYVLESYKLENEETGEVNDVYFNGLLNFKNGDKILVDIVGTVSSGGSSMDVSYGKYDTGVTFYEVPGQGLETEMPNIMPDSSGGIPHLDILGDFLPKFNAGPLTINAIIDPNGSMIFNVGFNVGLLNKTLKHQKKPDATPAPGPGATPAPGSDATPAPAPEENTQTQPAPTKKTVEEEAQELRQRYEAGELSEEEFGNEATALLAKTLEEIDRDDVEATPPDGQDPITIEEPSAEELANPVETAQKRSVGDLFDKVSQIKQTKDMLKKLNGARKGGGAAAVKDALAQGIGGIKFNIVLNVGFSCTMQYNGALQDWVFESATIFANVTSLLSGTAYTTIPVVPIPLYVGFSVSLTVGLYTGVGATTKVTMTEMTSGDKQQTASQNFYFKGNIPIMFGLELFVGVGIQRMLSLEFGGGFLQQFNLAFGPGGVGAGKTTFYGFVGISLVIFSGQWRFAQYSWAYQLYGPGTSSYEDSLLQGASDTLNMPLSNMKIIDETYANTFVGGNETVELMSALGATRTDMLLSDTTNITSEFVSLGDGKMLLVYTATDESRTKYNRKAAYYTIFDGSAWSAPQLLDAEPTLDIGLHVKDLGDEVVISWTKAQKEFTDADFGQEGSEVSANEVLKLMSATELYSIVASKEELKNGNMPQAEKITCDYVASEADIKGYAHQYGGTVKLSDGRIVLLYTTTDYNSYGEESVETLSELLSAPGIMLYRIYENGAWLEDYYPEETQYENIENFYGQRLLDINLRDESGTTYHPLSGYADVEVMEKDGEELVLVSYIYDVDSNLLTSNDRAVCLSILHKGEQALQVSLPIQLSETANVSNPQLHRFDAGEQGMATIVTWSQGNELMYIELSKLFHGVELSEEDIEALRQAYQASDEEYAEYESIESLIAGLTVGIEQESREINGREVRYYRLKDTESAKEAFPPIYNENGQKRSNPGNGYHIFSGNGRLYVVWAQSEGSEQHLMLSALTAIERKDGVTDLAFSDGVRINTLTDEQIEAGVKEYIMEPTGTVDEDGAIFIGYNRFDMELETGVNDQGQTVALGSKRTNNNYYITRTTPQADLIWADEDVTVSAEYPKAGETFIAEATVENAGLIPAENAFVTAELVAVDESGSETVIESKELALPEHVAVNAKANVSAEFEMTQELLDRAKGNQLDYMIRFTAPGESPEGKVIEGEIYVGSYLVIYDVNYHRFENRNRHVENGELVAGEHNGEYRYIVKASVRNEGNIDAENPGYYFEMENKHAFDSATPITPETPMREVKEILDSTPLNAHVMHDEDHVFYYDAAFYVNSDAESILTNETADFTIVSKSIKPELYSDSGMGNFAVSAADANDDEDAISDAHFFSDVLKEPTLNLMISNEASIVETATLEKGQQMTLNATILPLAKAPELNVIWSSDNEAVATVNEQGVVTAVANGNANITATIEGTEVSKTVAVTVKSKSGGKIVGGTGGSMGYYTVKFNTNGGEVLESQKLKSGAKLSEVIPTKEGYTFEGWYKDAELSQPYDMDAVVTGNMTLYAKWMKTEPWENPFADVKENDWFYGDVQYANENRLMNGTSDTTFAPNDKLTRAMLVTVLYRNEGEPATNRSIPFSDVDMGSYYANAVSWAQQNGIVKGISDTEFAPDADITREQIAAIMFRYAQYKNTAPTGAWAIRLDYKDLAEVSDYATEAVMYCTMKSIMGGRDDGTFAPKDNATRAETAAILHRFIEAN